MDQRQNGCQDLRMEQPSSQNNSPNKAFHTYGAQGAPRVNADVGTGIYMATARTMDPPPLKNKGHERHGYDLGKRCQEQPMKNRIQQGVAPLRATSGARVNADVGITK